MAVEMDEEELVEFHQELAEELVDSGFPRTELIAVENVFNRELRHCRIRGFRWRTPMADVQFTC